MMSIVETISRKIAKIWMNTNPREKELVMSQNPKKLKAFTFVEFVIVAVIILVIAVIAISSLMKQKEETSTSPKPSTPKPSLLAVGGKAPNWELKTPEGKTVSFESLRGNVMVLDFWAAWCGDCKKEMPVVQKLHERFKDQPVKFIGISIWKEKGESDPVEYMRSKGYTFTLLLNGDEVAEAYHVAWIPTFYVIDPEGRIVLASIEAGIENGLVKAISRALKDQ